MILAFVAGYLAFLVGVGIALSLAAPTIHAAEGGVVAAGHTKAAWDGRNGSAAAREDVAAAGAVRHERSVRPVHPAVAGSGPSGTPPPTDVRVGPGPAHPLRPAWGWVVLGLICFAVVLGLAWPDRHDPT